MKTQKDINYSINHVKERLKQRYKIEMPEKDFFAISARLSIDKSNIVDMDGADKEIYKVSYQGKKVIFVYDKVTLQQH